MTEPEHRADELKRKQTDLDEHHEGNRASADMDAPQPTREPTRDRSADRRPRPSD